MQDKTTFGYQSDLASYCRTGNYVSIPGVKEKNVVQYRRLVHNVVEDTLQSAYPLTYELLTPKEWKSLVSRFFKEHACSSPQVWYMPKELHEFIASKPSNLTKKYPFLVELLWFEWLEVELYMMEDVHVEHIREGDFAKERLVLNPEHHLQYFSFPVHLKNAKLITLSDKGHYFLVVHRHPESGTVSFTDLSPAFVRMIELLEERAMTIKEVLEKACGELGVEISSAIQHATEAFLESAMENKLIVGFEKICSIT